MPTFGRILAIITIGAGIMSLFGALTAGDLWPAFVGAGMTGLVTGVGLHLLADLVDAVRAGANGTAQSTDPNARPVGFVDPGKVEPAQPAWSDEDTRVANLVGWAVVIGVMFLIAMFFVTGV